MESPNHQLQELLNLLQNLVVKYQSMTPQEKGSFAINEDIGACIFLMWSILNDLINPNGECHGKIEKGINDQT